MSRIERNETRSVMSSTNSFLRASHTWGRRHASSSRYNTIPRLSDSSVETFRHHAFSRAEPFLLAPGDLASFPAIAKWFDGEGVVLNGKKHLNIEYLSRFGATMVPVEVTSVSGGHERFARFDGTLTDFLEFVKNGDVRDAHMYLAQCPISSLPRELQSDLPVPLFVSNAGKGDIYDSSIWLGLAPTYTSLHKDPNPNLFAQLAGTKIIRIFEPRVGVELFTEAQRCIGGNGSASIRGEEMMYGEEKRVLEDLIWNDERLGMDDRVIGLEATLCAGDGLFIPKGWWHSIKGVGDGIVGSVSLSNWLFVPAFTNLVL